MMRQDRHRHQAIGLLLTTLLTLAGAQGTAAAAEIRTVQLQNGNVYSGELVEWIPGDHVTLRLITGEIRRIAWTDLSLQPPPPAAPPAAAPPTAPPAAAPPSPTNTPPNAYPPNAYPPNAYPPNTYPPNAYPPDAFPPPGAPGGAQTPGTQLTIRTKNPNAQLTQTGGTNYVVGYGYGRYNNYAATIETWRPICTTPCNQVVPSGGPYRIAGPGIVPSAPFVLPAGSAELQVKTGSIGARIGGLFLTVIGGSAIITGGTLVGIGRSFGPGSPFYDPGEYASFRAGGGVVLGLGIGSLIAGIATLATSGTKVKIASTTGGLPNAVSLQLSPSRTVALSPEGLHF
ncbi:MAG TPA: hypothetical protein VH877_14570 [Polyangia bacterium]|nr:hypothetical protein [Polyangia bacterium]